MVYLFLNVFKMVLKKEYSNEGFIDAMGRVNSELKVLKNQINID
jgi:hypothetical protein